MGCYSGSSGSATFSKIRPYLEELWRRIVAGIDREKGSVGSFIRSGSPLTRTALALSLALVPISIRGGAMIADHARTVRSPSSNHETVVTPPQPNTPPNAVQQLPVENPPSVFVDSHPNKWTLRLTTNGPTTLNGRIIRSSHRANWRISTGESVPLEFAVQPNSIEEPHQNNLERSKTCIGCHLSHSAEQQITAKLQR